MTRPTDRGRASTRGSPRGSRAPASTPARALRLKLEPLGGEHEPIVIAPSARVLVGRSSGCDVRLTDSDAGVSRRHARFSFRDGGWRVVDLGGRGTVVNGLRCDGDSEVPLLEGDRLELGSLAFLVSLEPTDLAGPAELEVLDEGLALSTSRFDPGVVEASRILSTVIDLPGRLGKTSSEAEVYKSVCEYVGETLAPIISLVHVVSVSRGPSAEAEVIECFHSYPEEDRAPEVDRPLFSRRIIERVCKAGETVVFLHRTDETGEIDATVMPSTRVVGACLLEYGPAARQTIILYAHGDHRLVEGERWVAGCLHLVATLARQHILSLRRAALASYFSPSVVRMLMQGDGRSIAEGEPRVVQVTSLFFDLRGFSFRVEASASDLFPMHADLKRVMDIVTAAVFEADGMIVDFQGDGAFAAWGVPFEQPDHADRAVRCARDLVHALDSADLRTLRADRAGKSLCGIGVASGEVLAGPVGSTGQLKYGVIGPAVNIAARLQSLTRPGRLGAPVLIDEETRRRLTDQDLLARPVGSLKLEGLSKPVKVHEVLPRDPTRDAMSSPEFLARWREALHTLERARRVEDLEEVERLAAGLPETHPRVQWLSRMCRRFRDDPATLLSWRGVVPP